VVGLFGWLGQREERKELWLARRGLLGLEMVMSKREWRWGREWSRGRGKVSGGDGMAKRFFFFFKEGGAFYREDGNEGCVLKVEDLLKIFTSLYR
jgi:hypothetical protein